MLNLSYLNYYLKSKKYLLIFILLSNLILGCGMYISGEDLQSSRFAMAILAIILCFVLPCINFAYIHDKKAIDTYFAIPVSRKDLLINVLLCTILSIFVPCLIGDVALSIAASTFVLKNVAYLLLVLFVISTLVLVNTMFYSFANNTFDGVVLIGAYHMIPVLLYILVVSFIQSYICGYSINFADHVFYASPVGDGGSVLLTFIDSMRIINPTTLNKAFYLRIAVLAVYLVISMIVVYKTYINRKVERANTNSNELFAYPFIIYSYTLILLFAISSNFSCNYQSLRFFIADDIVLYLMLFVAFVVAHFVYKRKFYFSISMPAFYVIVMALSITVCSFARNTDGFGLAYKYPGYEEGTRYFISTYMFNDDNELSKWFYEKVDNKYEDLSFSIQAGLINDEKPLKEETVQILESYRKKAIEYFYDNNKSDLNPISFNINIETGRKFDKNGYDKDFNYYCHNCIPTMDELMTLAQDPNVVIIFDNYANGFVLMPDGSLKYTEESIYYYD